MKKRILFVDDEPKILQGLRRMLRGMRNEWDMKFADSGPEALELMDKESFDVIVSDMKMPKMDGVQLLNEVKNRFPHMVRIVLSGHSEKEMIMESVQPAHQYLSKPCDAETLKSIIGRACALRDLLAKDSLVRSVSQMDSLPSLPTVYTELMNEIESPAGSIQRVGEIIAKDLGMTAKVLQLVNSSFFGIPRHISNPSQAVNLMGFDTVRSLVLTIGVFAKLDQKNSTDFNAEELFNHSIKTGAISKEIAKGELLNEKLVDDAFIAGLLHDIGKLVYATHFPDKYPEVYTLAREQKIPLVEAEFQKIGATHADIGAYLLGLWGLPDDIVEAVAFHHVPSRCLNHAVSPLTAVHIGNALEHEQRTTSTNLQKFSAVEDKYLEILGVADKLSVWREFSTSLMESEKENE